MSPSGLLAVGCWGGLAGLLFGYAIWCNIRAWWESRKRPAARARRVPPRPAQTREWDWPSPLVAEELSEWDSLAAQIEAIRSLPETEPKRRLA